MKKTKQILLSLILLVSFNAISQNATERKPYPVLIQENNVIIDTAVARLIANDLVSGDVCKLELKITKNNLDLTKKQLVLKDSIIGNVEKQKNDLIKIISKKDEIFAKQEEISATYKKDLSKQKRTTFLYKLLSLLGIISTTYLIIK